MSKQHEIPSKDLAKEHYDDHFECYRQWSSDRSAGYHFGVARKIGDFFDNDKMLQNASEMIFEQLKLDDSKPCKILDAGCGAGQVSRLLAKQHPKTEIFGVTISKKQLKLGRELLARDNLASRVKLFHGDFERLDFADNSFDAVFFQDSICHGAGIAKSLVLKEAARVLKKGGRIALTDGFVFPKKGGKAIAAVNRTMSSAFGVSCWAEEKEFLRMLEQSGFVEIKRIDLTWKAGPSVAQTAYFKLPKVVFAYLRKELELKDVAYTLKVAVLAPILGLHPYFKYQLISARKN